MKKKFNLFLIALFGLAGLTVNGAWTVSNALDEASDLNKVSAFDNFTGAIGEASTLTLLEDPTGTLKNPDGTPAIVVEALGSQTEGAAFVQSYNFPEPAPTDSVYTVYWRWMYPTGGARSHQELATLAGESEILVDGQLLKANGPWFHNWSDLAFCYNGGGAWVCGPDIGLYEADTWYEYFMVIDPANISYDWYIRGGEFTEITPIFQDALYANLDTIDPLKAIQQIHYMSEGGLFGPQYYDAMYIDTTGENMATPAELGSIFGGAGGSTWTEMNALDVAADLDKVDAFDVFNGATGEPGTLTLIEDPTGTLKNLDGSPAIVVEALGSQTADSHFIQSYNFPEPAPTDSVYTIYYRWMYPTGGTVSHQELAIYAGQDEILVDGSVLKGNGPWYHNWSSLGFCYNGGGAWECEPPLGQFLADTWYEYWLVIDPANISYDWYIRGGDFTEISVVYLDALYANLDTTAPLKAIQQMFWNGQDGLFGPQYYDAMYIDTDGENLATPPALASIFGGETVTESWAEWAIDDEAGNVDTGDWMGWINVAKAPWIYSFDLETWLYIEEANVGTSGSWAFVTKQGI